MKTTTTLIAFCLAFPVITFAQNNSSAEPPELQAKRQEYLQAIERATVPLRTGYLRSLEALKAQFTRTSKLEAALAVDEEIKRLDATATAAATQTLKTKALPITIVSATYGDPETKRVANIERTLRQAYQSGLTTFRLDERSGRSGKDPAPGAKKVTTIEYSIDGKLMKKTFPEGHNLDFSRDLQ